MKMTWAVALAVVGLLFVGCGCGSDDDDDLLGDGDADADTDADGDADADTDADGDGDGDGDADCDDQDGDGYDDAACGGDDCDDGSQDIHPGATDDPGDCIDQNCDGVDGPDEDGDGVASPACGGDDCDDADADVYPGATDMLGDGVDQDCDGADGTDSDGDGYASVDSGGDDCNDFGERIHPGAADDFGDGIDQNCDGADGVDADGDDYGSTESGGPDCDDADPAVNPSAADDVGDGLDQNCDGLDGVDADGDRFASIDSGGDDCDDSDPSIHPGAPDFQADGIDQDCDGIDPDDNCGNGQIDFGEVCDDGNRLSGDRCSRDCLSDETCGNGYVDAAVGEQCDDGDVIDGPNCSADCTSDKTCGNGVLDAGETCDDGNHAAGDGCSFDCASTEICGNSIIDFATGELCDDGPEGSASCGADCQPIGCGDGATVVPETCDDGNETRWDGCGPDCRLEQSVVFDSLEIVDDAGCDLTGDGQPDNAFGEALSDVLSLFNGQIADAIDAGTLLVMFDFLNLDDATGQDDPAVYLSVYQAQDADGNAGNNLSGGADLLIDPVALDPVTCDPLGSLSGSIAAGDMTAGPGDLVVSFPLAGGQPTVLDIQDALVTGSIVAAAGQIHDIDNGRICGALTATSLSYVDNPAGFGPPTVLDVLVVGLDFFGITVAATQPDVDFDRDGLETLADTDGDEVVDTCVDGDGTVIAGEDCVRDPRIADGYSTLLTFTAIFSHITGIADPGCP